MRIEETATKSRIENTSEAWEEGALGRDEQYVQVSDGNLDSELDASLGLQLISIRLQKSLIEDFKMIAQYHGDIGYQTLMRQILRRFATSEAKRILREVISEKQAARAAESEAADENGDSVKVA